MILLTGNRGFIGRKLAAKIGEHIGIDLVDGLDLLTCELPKGVDIIYHLAAQSSVEESWEYPMYDSKNAQMTLRLIENYPKAKIIHAQSAAAVLPLTSPYAISKFASEQYLTLLHEDYVNCIFPNVYGGGKGVVDIFKDKEEVEVFGDGLQTRDFVHVDDIVEGLLKAKNWPTGNYFMGSGVPTTILELAGGKRRIMRPARKEVRESVLPNTTPNWSAAINVHDYLTN